ncbi:MAG: hypothetical protein D6741_00630, partial [Planctomycetota bacterium]
MNVLPSLRNVLFFVATVAVFGTGSDQVLSAENPSRWPEIFDRGIVALSDVEGVRVLWRLLPSDPPDTAFHVFRVEGKETLRLTEKPIEDVTYFVDRTAEKGHRYGYFVQPIVGNTKGKPSKKAFVTPTGTTAAYLSIPLRG